MNAFGLAFHHLGLAVRRPDSAVAFLRGLGYAVGEPVYDARQKTRLILCTAGDQPAVEIICPGDEPGPLDNLLKTRDELIYHVCYTTPSVDRALAAMRQGGLHVVRVAPPNPAILFAEQPVSFYHVVGFGLIELLEQTGEVR
jgi:catechol 2,3-dioxygenase-like lactoylglutathione lyase family enzyme